MQVVGCDGTIGSDQRLDRCGVCGGNNSSCHVISGIFTRTRLPPGYNRVTSVPRGACNINVTELVFSPNHLGTCCHVLPPTAVSKYGERLFRLIDMRRNRLQLSG